jgi:uncharacterized protein (DUF2126 family)
VTAVTEQRGSPPSASTNVDLMPFTGPYNDVAWKNILGCGETVESSLRRDGVALTMGGEPTFVPLSPAGAEWQTAALGPSKLAYARKLARHLISNAYPGAVVLETSGKLFPGEPLPRWTLLIQRRADAQPVWRDPLRLSGDLGSAGHSPGVAGKLIHALSGALRLQLANVLPLAETVESARIVGYVLPLDGDGTAPWISDDWKPALGKGPVELFPGESAAGLRLPLGRLGKKNLRRALTVELREGTLTVFVPPLVLAAYCALLTVIEDTLAKLELRDVVLAGYAPLPDPALPTIGLASDPGVLEVNMTPCATWAEFDGQLEQLYTAAHAVGLCARKLHYNGREAGTGGGAHLVFGGPPEQHSPFFRFPALLPSIIRYWQRHPALSYAFTGSYLGPSSQAPRIDESTYEALYELEIACSGAESIGSPQNLPLYDLLFRDLLMDRSGNTHRAEISVDKLWNPFAPNGRLGLVEFRAFETHPLRAIQSVTALFIRAIVARLCAAPFREPFIRWAGELHDRFFLPAFVWEDLASICADLKSHGIGFDLEWLRFPWDWRFPMLGTLELKQPDGASSKIEFRQALEAWPLLGESPNAGTVARTVDSTVDRIEARVADAGILEQGLLLVNGFPCEFRATAEGGAAAGIRYRAFYLTPSLQPHVPVHAPLLIEWVDRATLAVVAAARWHVWNPRSQSYSDIPEDAKTAQARRLERWEPWPHTVGQSRFVPKIDFPPEGRHTLDLRRYPAQAR